MKAEQLDEILACLPKGRTKFYYFRDRYCLDLLAWYLGGGKTVAEIKRSPYARLLRKPLLRDLCARIGGGLVTPPWLMSAWPARPLAFLLTLGRWGESRPCWRTWHQMSRPGVNLVLQLNFSGMHDRRYLKLIRPIEDHPFEFYLHPINTEGRRTLAWSRLDVSLELGEALIEEIQCDWIGYALYARLRECEDGQRQLCGEPVGADEVSLDRYRRQVLAPYVGIWDEAMLTAALWFLRQELGIRRVYYHTFESGNRIKGLTDRRPPRSLYTALPRRFCFRQTSAPPALLATVRNRPLRRMIRQGGLRWFVLEI